jgi:hypothetical protein
VADDRFSPEQQAIDAAAQAAPPPPTRTEPVRCGSPHPRTKDAPCQLGRGHEGNHRHDLPDGRRLFWWGTVTPEEIDEFAARFAAGKDER